MSSRRDFLNRFRKPLTQTKEDSPLVVRPPYGLNESLFQSECVACVSKPCVTSCDEQIILYSKMVHLGWVFPKVGVLFVKSVPVYVNLVF